MRRLLKQIEPGCLRLSSGFFVVLLILFVAARFFFPVPVEYLVWAAATGFLAAVYIALTYPSAYAALTLAIIGIGHEWTREWFYPQYQYPWRFFKANGVWLSVQWILVMLVSFSLVMSFLLITQRVRQPKD